MIGSKSRGKAVNIKIRPPEPRFVLELPRHAALELYVHLRETAGEAVDKDTQDILLDVTSSLKQFLLRRTTDGKEKQSKE